MKYTFTKSRKIAVGLLAIWCVNLFAPTVAYALTSGPAQPEVTAFQPAGITDMVDLQSGELKYNIPLLDIDGYPINLNYQSTPGMDDEASWVGLGWSLNPGAINRQVRGLPDDFTGGADTVETDHYTKPKITVGGKITAKVEIKGTPAFGTFTFGIFSDNYNGIGAELGVNAGISYSFANSSALTAGLGVGVLSNTQSGVTVTPYMSLSIKNDADNKGLTSAGLSASLGYNSRSGLKDLTLGTSFNTLTGIYGASHTYNTEPIVPSAPIEHQSSYSSFSFDLGPALFAVFPALGGTGYRNVMQVKNVRSIKPAYGFLYAEQGKKNPDALMDFIREKDNPVIPELPNLAIPIHTPDMWSYSSQSGGGQFKLFRGGSGAFFDSKSVDNSSVVTAGFDAGAGLYAHGGVTLYDQHTTTTTQKWQNDNNYLVNGDFQDISYSNPSMQHAYFRQLGEKGLQDETMNGKLQGTNALEVSISNITTAISNVTMANSAFRNAGNLYGVANPVTQALLKKDRRQNRTGISYLTASEARYFALDTTINEYPLYESGNFTPAPNNKPFPTHRWSRKTKYRKGNHISEVTVTDDGGKRMVYGLPVYNNKQEEYSFAVGTSASGGNNNYPANNLVNVPNISTPSSNGMGIDNYYHKESKSAYATSYLLSGILSPDYVDKTGDGITDDDLGTAIKFNYSRLPFQFKWRTPYTQSALNKCLLADPDDDKGSIVYGEKEIYYVSSIESKTKLAYFITQDRSDALGVNNATDGGADPTRRQRCLKEIRLYSKADTIRPIKVVKFEYNYELCRGVPNSVDQNSSDPAKGGKLTLKKVWFQYGNSSKGQYHPYQFEYNKSTNGAEGVYAYMTADRWGTYKRAAENSNGLTNEEYPYATQDTATANHNTALWHLRQITLPTGGVINVDYESNDYAYVQDKKAMVMTGIEALIDKNRATVTSLTAASGLRINIGSATPGSGDDPTTWFKKNFLDGSDYLYTKMNVQLSTSNKNTAGITYYDYVPVYCKVQSVTVTGGHADVIFQDINESSVVVNPMSNAAWQRIKNEYPRYAYPGFDNRVQTSNSTISGAINAIISAASNLSELKKNFYQKARDKGYASNIILSKCFAKITKSDGFKLGGGARVKAIHITDQWQQMVGNNDYVTSSYGQAYNYTTVEDGKTVSSGVATYEPSVGNDENALKEPVDYIGKQKGAINNYYELEKPFCESLYPAPTIGYSKVTVHDLDQSGNPSNKTGYIVNEYYTAKDFPVKVNVLDMISKPFHATNYAVFKTNSIDKQCLSQGYSIELNDMHGKPLATRVFNQSGAEISSTVYYYSPDNKVNVVNSQGQVLPGKVLGRDIEFFTDFREQEANNAGSAINLGFDIIPALFFPLFLPHWPVNNNNDYKLFRSACALKVVQNYGIVTKVVKTENGSSVTTENVAFDMLTGEPLVTRTQNEFNKDIFSVNIPAYWAYKGMGAAYQNLGTVLQGFNTDAAGQVPTNYASYLQGGDEVCDLSSGARYWVIDNQAPSGTGNSKKLIKQDGTLAATFTPVKYVKVVRSGYRNMLTAATASIVCLNNPIVTDGANQYLRMAQPGHGADDLTSLKVINATANTFDENWAVEKSKCGIPPDPTSYAVENTTRNFSLSKTTPNLYPLWLIGDNAQISVTSSAYWGGNVSTNSGRRGVMSFWPSEAATVTYSQGSDQNHGDYFGFDAVVVFPKTKVYYFIFAHDYPASYSIDCANNSSGGPVGLAYGEYLQYIGDRLPIPAGKHIIHCVFKLRSQTGNDIPFQKRCAGLEIYDNTLDELANADSVGTGLNLIFSTKDYAGNNNVYNFFDQDGTSYTDLNENGHQSYHYTRPDGLPVFYNYFSYMCNTPVTPAFNSIINPYTTGYLGNWRPYQTKVFQKNRNYNDIFSPIKPGIDVKNAGYINNFYSYWYNNGSSWDTNPHEINWVNANTVTLYDKYGQQLENKDALNRYSAANFDFNGELPAAVASNAMNREIYSASFEDSRFVPGTVTTTDSCNRREFQQVSTLKTIKQLSTTTISHSGNYSANLPSTGVTLTTTTQEGQHKTAPYLSLTSKNEYRLVNQDVGLYPNGFEPYPGKKYIFNTWVNDGTSNDKSIHITANMNGTNIPLTCKAVVEGWKLMEGTFTTPSGNTAVNISILPSNSGNPVYLDDIRMHPFDAQMKTYAYDDKTMRLMAELDENGFATFYEYDDEGLLIRVKKETEKGIMTLKETRSSYIKTQLP